jgi:hypothetical protein
MNKKDSVNVYFSDYFDIPHETVEEHGAFDVSLINDLPLFIDPFLLFNSSNPAYRKLHDNIITYLRFLRDASTNNRADKGLLYAWFMFSEVKQNWLGFSMIGNKGSGLGFDFAEALNRNLTKVFTNFGGEQVTQGSHLEKLCLIGSGVGRDNISDFTTNLIKEYLLEYTQNFARNHLTAKQRKVVRVEKVRFNYNTETWESGEYDLPYIFNDFVILTPSDMLTKGEIWINKDDMVKDYRRALDAVSDIQLRSQLNNYFIKVLSSLPKKVSKKEKDAVIMRGYQDFPELLDYYIRFKEDTGDEAVDTSAKIVAESKQFYIDQISRFVGDLNRITDFYSINGNTYNEAKERVLYLKDVVENKGGHRIFYDTQGKPIKKETDLHILYRLTWFATPLDVTREANDGRGPVDFKITQGAFDKTLVEFKLASNPQLERNLQNQAAIYQRASDAPKTIKVIFYFNRQELNRISNILRQLKLVGDQDIVLVDARRDNKPSGSKAKTSEIEDPDEIKFSDVDWGDVDTGWDLPDNSENKN